MKACAPWAETLATNPTQLVVGALLRMFKYFHLKNCVYKLNKIWRKNTSRTTKILISSTQLFKCFQSEVTARSLKCADLTI